MVLNKKSIEILKDISAGINKRIGILVTENPVVSDILSELKSTMFEELNSDDSNGLKDYIDFISKAGILSYYGRLDNDKNVQRLKESDEVKLEFGFCNFGSMISSTVEFFEDSEKSTGKTVGCIQSCLLSSLRDISLKEYIEGGYANNDIHLIAVLGNRSKSELNEFIMSFIKNDDTINSFYLDSLEQVLTTYKYLFQDSFGLRPYVGVVSFSAPYLRTINDNMKLGTLGGARATFDSVRNTFEKDYDVNEVLDRQFNIKKIIYESDSKPCYYPIKILEYAMGRELTYELSENVYRNYANNDSWDNYAQGYVKPQITEYFCECIYYSLERHFNIAGITSEGVEDFFLSEKFASALSTIGENVVKSYMSSAEMAKHIKADLNKLKRSLCTAVLVVKYANLGKQISSLTIRCVNTTGSLRTSMSRALFSSFTSNESTKFEEGDVISNGKFVGGDSNKPLPFEIIEYRHDFDSTLATIEPLFGYKAVELFQRRGVKLGWSKILLGEDIKGTPVFASLDDIDDLPMQLNTVHNMMAGSRAGKGVMTMNILVSGLASGKPIFYIDRKPDMAVLFYELSQGNMFIVNGGQYEGKNDMNGFFGGKSIAIQGWETAYDSMPDYLKKEIFTDRSYAGRFGDMVYFRAVIFTLGILMARTELAGNGEVYNKLGGDSGIIVIVDEFKNWQELFESAMFVPNGVLANKHRLKKQMTQAYKKLQNNIKIKSAELETLDPSDPKSVPKITKLNLEIEALRSEAAELITEIRVYCTSFADKYGESTKHISEKLSAGFADKEGKLSDVFVIGQHIDIDGFNGAAYGSGLYPQRDGGDFNANQETNNKSLMRGIFNRFKHDWFMGYNHESDKTKMYMGANKEGSQGHKWIEQAYWGYCNEASMNDLRTSCPQSTVFFKPYLVLNKHFEDDPKNPKKILVDGGDEMVTHPDYTFVSQCRDRVNKVPNLWETVRLKHLKSEDFVEDAVSGVNKHYDELNEGIGFQGLANMTKQCNGQGNFNPSVDLGASKAIADYVASCMGYSCYQELLFDFTPEGIFSTKDVCNALANPEGYKATLSQRLPLFAEYGMIGSGNQEVSPESIGQESELDDDAYAGFQVEDEPESSQSFDFQSEDDVPQAEPQGEEDFSMSGFVDEDEEDNLSGFTDGYDTSDYENEFESESHSFSSEEYADSVTDDYDSYGSETSGYAGDKDSGLSYDDIIRLTSEVTSSVFMEFLDRYGKNVRDEYVRCAITTRSAELVNQFIREGVV